MSKTWKILEALFAEAKQYRGESGLPFAEINKMMQGTENRPGITGRPANPNGEAVDGNGYKFDPKIWGEWFSSQDHALGKAASDSMKVPGQHAGKPQGDMSFKTTWGQKVVNQPGKARGDFERLGSAMDRYDILMQADIGKTPKGRDVGVIHRIAYSPSIGSYEERKARLVAMISGQSVGAPQRRPQPDRPQFKPDAPRTSGQATSRGFTQEPAQPVARQGVNNDIRGRATAPERGSPERAEWDAKRAQAKKDLGIPSDVEFTDWLKAQARKTKED